MFALRRSCVSCINLIGLVSQTQCLGLYLLCSFLYHMIQMQLLTRKSVDCFACCMCHCFGFVQILTPCPVIHLEKGSKSRDSHSQKPASPTHKSVNSTLIIIWIELYL